jgi:hypothetical protein
MRTFVLLSLLSLAGVATWAETVSLNPFIANPGFESPTVPSSGCCSFPSGWSEGGPGNGGAGNWDPTTWAPAANLNAYSGSQIAYINNSSGQDGFNNYYALDETLSGVTLVAGTTYTLTYAVASRADLVNPAAFRVQINGNASAGCPTCFAVTTGSTGDFAAGVWKLFTVSYTAQAADGGTSPTIYLVNDGATNEIGGPVAQVEFDISPVPEPAALALLAAGVVALACLRKWGA